MSNSTFDAMLNSWNYSIRTLDARCEATQENIVSICFYYIFT
jgi:hypothetical protein